MSIPFKSEPVYYCQHRLSLCNVFDLLADAHDCYLFDELFQQLDTSDIEAQYSRMWQHAYYPRNIVGILIYGYSQ